MTVQAATQYIFLIMATYFNFSSSSCWSIHIASVQIHKALPSCLKSLSAEKRLIVIERGVPLTHMIQVFRSTQTYESAM
jgi:hypothetical protein